MAPGSGIVFLVWRKVKRILKGHLCLVNSSPKEQMTQSLGRPAVDHRSSLVMVSVRTPNLSSPNSVRASPLPPQPNWARGYSSFSGITGTCEAAVTVPYCRSCLPLVTRPRKVLKLPIRPVPHCRQLPTWGWVSYRWGPLTCCLPHCLFRYNLLTAIVCPHNSSHGFYPWPHAFTLGPMLLPRTFQNTSEPILQASPPSLSEVDFIVTLIVPHL